MASNLGLAHIHQKPIGGKEAVSSHSLLTFPLVPELPKAEVSVSLYRLSYIMG